MDPAHAGLSSYSHPAIDDSALLALRDLRFLQTDGWNIYIRPRPTPSGSSGGAPELKLTELSVSTWQHDSHEGLLHAALREGKEAAPVKSTQ